METLLWEKLSLFSTARLAENEMDLCFSRLSKLKKLMVFVLHANLTESQSYCLERRKQPQFGRSWSEHPGSFPALESLYLSGDFPLSFWTALRSALFARVSRLVVTEVYDHRCYVCDDYVFQGKLSSLYIRNSAPAGGMW